MRIKLLEYFRNKNYLVDYDNFNRKVIKSNYIALYSEDKIKIKELFNDYPDKLYKLDNLDTIYFKY
jgi:hypothetical protein